MRALISLFLGTMMLNASVNAGSPTKSSNKTKGAEAIDENMEVGKGNPHAWEKQEMENVSEEELSGQGRNPGFEKQATPYKSGSTAKKGIHSEE